MKLSFPAIDQVRDSRSQILGNRTWRVVVEYRLNGFSFKLLGRRDYLRDFDFRLAILALGGCDSKHPISGVGALGLPPFPAQSKISPKISRWIS